MQYLFALLISVPVMAADWHKDKEAFAYAKAHAGDKWVAPEHVRSTNYQKVEIDPAYLKDKLTELTALGERRSSDGREKVRAWLNKEFSALGFTTSIHDYGGGGKNFVAERSAGTRVLVLGAHIDSVGNAGANDDGAGVIGALAIAKALQTRALPYTLRFVGFDQEEIGLVGSRAYARALPAIHSIAGVIQLEMLATNGRKDRAVHVIDCDRADSKFLSDHVLGANLAAGFGLTRSPACTKRSDHKSFWDVGIPAIVIAENFFGGDPDPCYHRTCDTVSERLDFDFMSRITGAIATALASADFL